MNIILTGLPLFAKRLCDELSSFDKKNKYFFYNTYYSRKDRFKFIFKLLFTDIIISLNGVSDKSGSMDWVLRFRKKLIFLWQGTDVMLAKERYVSNSILSKYISYATHYTDATWLADELSGINISAGLLFFKSIALPDNTERFEEINAYSYVPKGKEYFYGLDKLLKAFKKLPDIKLFIYGTNGDGFEKTDNVFYKGWMPSLDYKKEISNHSICIRLTEHDGYSMSVIEALSNGSEVIWNYPLEHCHYVSDNTDELVAKIIEISGLFIKRNYARNHDAENWIRQNFDPDKILRTFIEKIIF